MPSTDWSAKRKRQYQHIKDSVLARRESLPLAEEIAARACNGHDIIDGNSSPLISVKGFLLSFQVDIGSH